MVRVRDRRRQPRVGFAVLQRAIDAVGILVRMCQVVVRGEIIGRRRQRLLVVRNRAGSA